MSTQLSAANAISLEKELIWFSSVLDTRIALYFEHDTSESEGEKIFGSIEEIPLPDLSNDDSAYGSIVSDLDLEFDERILLALTLVPHIRPDLLDLLFTRNKNFDRGFTQFGGWKGESHGGFIPTCETAAFIIAGNDLSKRFKLLSYFEGDGILIKNSILTLEHKSSGEPFMSAAVRISSEYLNRLTSGVYQKPDYSMNFPAKLITTKLTWDDLILPMEVREEIENIITWIKNSKIIL